MPDLFVVGTFREVESRSYAAIDAALGRVARHACVLSLKGFYLDEASRFVELAAGEAVPQAIVRRLHDETVVVRSSSTSWCACSAAVATCSVGGSSALPISQGVRGAIRQRLAPLAVLPLRYLLSVAAVAGRGFDLPLLEAATGMRGARSSSSRSRPRSTSSCCRRSPAGPVNTDSRTRWCARPSTTRCRR